MKPKDKLIKAKKVVDISSISGYGVRYMQDRRPAPKKAPSVHIRFRSKVEIGKIERAAMQDGLSFNTFVACYASAAAEEILALMAREKAANLRPTDAVS